MKNRSRRGRGFTLAELLIVVAIVAVLTAVAIPVFAAQLEKSREATDTANIRAQYAEVMTKANETGNDVNETGSELGMVPLQQHKGDWQNDADAESLGNIATVVDVPAPGGMAWVSYSDSTGAVIHFTGGSGGTEEQNGGTQTKPSVVDGYLTNGWNHQTFTSEFKDIALDKHKQYMVLMDGASVDFTATVLLYSKPSKNSSLNAGDAVEIKFEKGKPVEEQIKQIGANNFHLEIVTNDSEKTLEELEDLVKAAIYMHD